MKPSSLFSYAVEGTTIVEAKVTSVKDVIRTSFLCKLIDMLEITCVGSRSVSR